MELQPDARLIEGLKTEADSWEHLKNTLASMLDGNGPLRMIFSQEEGAVLVELTLNADAQDALLRVSLKAAAEGDPAEESSVLDNYFPGMDKADALKLGAADAGKNRMQADITQDGDTWHATMLLQGNAIDRITSYNVCYTKLLRAR